MVDKSPRQKSARAKAARRKQANRKQANRWSARVTRESNALDLDAGVFKLDSPKRIAASLKRSAEHSKRRKAEPYRSALSMLVFYVNRPARTCRRRDEGSWSRPRASCASCSIARDHLAQRMILIRPAHGIHTTQPWGRH